MKTPKINRSMSLAAAAMAGALLLSACGSSGGGGDTTCKEYVAMDTEARVQTIKDFAKSEGEDLGDATDDEIKMGADLLGVSCSLVKDDSVKLKNIDEADFDDSLTDLELPDLDDIEMPEMPDLGQ